MSQQDAQDSALRLPRAPGVYLFKDQNAKVIYVGKAKDLRARVGSYFSRSVKDGKTLFLVEKIDAIDTVLTDSESEAFLLENSLIKRFTPRYNINLKDGKSYPVIRLTAEEFPRVYRTRTIVFDGSEYFGPFAKANQIDVYLDLVDRLFPLRKRGEVFKLRAHPCLNHHINRCAAPCIAAISADEYGERVRSVRTLVSGRGDDLTRDLEQQMRRAASDRQFERAAIFRDQIEAIREVNQDQRVAGTGEDARDYVGHFRGDSWHLFVVFQFRAGNLVGKERFHVPGPTPDATATSARSRFLLSYYGSRGTDMSGLVIYTEPIDDRSTVQAVLRELSRNAGGRRRPAAPQILIPERGEHANLLRLARANARQDAERAHPGIDRERGVEELCEALGLPREPRRIEGFDISHLGGRDTVASLVVFQDGKPAKSEYRSYKIRSLHGRVDDFEAIREVIARRYSRLLNDGLERPDLVLVDGGAGQVSAAQGILNGLGLADLPLAGLAKRNEAVFLPRGGAPVVLQEASSSLRLLQAVRDESHRFATTFNKRLRTKRIARSTLEEILGIGPARSRRLLQHFQSVDKIASATTADVARSAGISEETAARLLDHLSRRRNRAANAAS